MNAAVFSALDDMLGRIVLFVENNRHVRIARFGDEAPTSDPLVDHGKLKAQSSGYRTPRQNKAAPVIITPGFRGKSPYVGCLIRPGLISAIGSNGRSYDFETSCIRSRHYQIPYFERTPYLSSEIARTSLIPCGYSRKKWLTE